MARRKLSACKRHISSLKKSLLIHINKLDHIDIPENLGMSAELEEYFAHIVDSQMIEVLKKIHVATHEFNHHRWLGR